MRTFDPQYAGAHICPSPNYGSRRNGMVPDALILHYTGMETGEAAQAWLCNPQSEVSCHYIVHEDGRVVQMVREEDRAWHAGQGSWGGREDVNSFSIGIEIVNRGHFLGYPDFPGRQIKAVIALGLDICRRNKIAAECVLAHSDVAPGRKIDPGEKFPWAELAENGLGHFVAPAELRDGGILAPGDAGPAVEELRYLLASYGYGLDAGDTYDETVRVVIEAFQRHFRPQRVNGIADAQTLETLRRLSKSLPLRVI